MNDLPGNPYAEDLEPMRNTSTITDATLALAFEQRTRAFIELAALCTANGRKELGEPFIAEAIERIGMNGGDD